MYGKKERRKRLAFDIFLGLIGVVIVCLVTLFVQTQFTISQQKENSNDKLDIAVQRIESNKAESADRLKQFDSFSQAKVDSIAYYYENNADDLNSLNEMAGQWGLNSLYILDNNRKIIAKTAVSEEDLESGELSSLWTDAKAVTVGELRYYVASMVGGGCVVGSRDMTAFNEQEAELTSMAYALHTVKVGSKGYISVINKADQTIVYNPDDSMIGKTVSEIGLDTKVMDEGYEGWVGSGDRQFYCESRSVELDGENYQFVALRPRDMMEASIYKLVFMITLTFAVIMLLVILYIHFIRTEQDKRFENDGTEMEYIHLGGKLYFNQTIGSKAVHILLIGLVVIFLSSFYMQTLSVLSTRSAHSAEKLEDIADIFDENQTILEDMKQDYVEEYEGRAKNIAYLLGKDPSLVEDEKLIELSQRAQVKYIYIFNYDGNIVSSNGIFSEFSISHESDHASYVFWNVIKGSEDIIIMDAEPDVYDEGAYIQYIGTSRLDAPGMVELGISPERLDAKIKAVDTAYTLENIAVENNGFLFAVDKESGNIKYYSDENLIDSPASAIGLQDSALNGNYTGYQDIDGVQCFVSSMEYDNEYIYVAVPVSSITEGRIQLSLIVTGSSLVILLLILVLSLIGQPKKILTQKVEKNPDEPLKEPRGTFDVVTGSGKVRKVESVLSRWSLTGIK